MMDGMSIRKKSDIDIKSGRLTGYVDFGRSQSPLETDNAPLAGDALVLMAVGLVAAWKIPIGYFLNNGLTGSILKNIIVEAITMLEEYDLEVVAVVCDGLASNVMMGKLLGCRIHEDSAENFKTSFPHPKAADREISLIFDAAHGLKLLRNLFGDKKTLESAEYGIRK